MAASAFGCKPLPWDNSRALVLGDIIVVVPTPTVKTHPGISAQAAHNERVTIFPLPLSPLETFLFRSDTAQSPMVIRVVLRFTGTYQLELLSETLRRAISRHPLLNCCIDRKGRTLQWVTGCTHQIKVGRVPGSVLEQQSGLISKSIDLTKEAGLQAEILEMDDGIKVVLDGHHAVTDGNGIRQVVTDWLHLYHCEVYQLPSRLPVIDPDRLDNRHQFRQPPAIVPIGVKEAIRNLIATIRGRTSRWSPPKKTSKTSNDAACSYCVERILSPEQYDAVQQHLSRWGVTLNDFMMACCMSTFAQLAPPGSMSHRVTVLNPTDLRLPSDRTMPAANRFGVAFMRRTRAECCNPGELLRGIHDEMSYVRTNYIGVEFIKGLATASKVPGGVNLLRRMGLFIPSLQWTCLGDVTRGGRRLMLFKDGFIVTGNLKLEAVSGFAPFAENVPLSVATCETGRRITLTIRANPLLTTAEETLAFASMLETMMCSFECPSDEAIVPKPEEE